MKRSQTPRAKSHWTLRFVGAFVVLISVLDTRSLFAQPKEESAKLLKEALEVFQPLPTKK
jgi:hypothetical protein